MLPDFRRHNAILADKAQQKERSNMMASPPEPTATQRRYSREHFAKTKMCTFEAMGMCAKGVRCPFAHSKSELHSSPDLSRTKMCKAFLRSGECKVVGCKYAHSQKELREPNLSKDEAPLAKQHAEKEATRSPVRRGLSPMKIPLGELNIAPPVVLGAPAFVEPMSIDLDRLRVNEVCGFSGPQTSVSVNQRGGYLNVSHETSSSGAERKVDVMKPLRSVRTSETTLCSLADRPSGHSRTASLTQEWVP